MKTRTVLPDSGLLPQRVVGLGVTEHRDRWEFWATVKLRSGGNYSPRLEVSRRDGESGAMAQLQSWLVSVVAMAPEASELVSSLLIG